MPTIRFERRGALGILRLDKARGNAIDPPLVEDLVGWCAEAAADNALRGVLLASANPKLFCPGLDLVTLYELDREAMGRFIARFAEMLFALYELRQPVVAAISGHAVAGGCILALACDYRVLRRGGVQIGLNEVKVGVPLPWAVSVLLRSAVPPTALAPVALLGRNFSDDEALSVGLVDALADAEDFEGFCLARLEEFAEKDPASVGATKAYLRYGVVREMRSREEASRPEWLDAWFSEATRERIRQTVASLSKPK